MSDPLIDALQSAEPRSKSGIEQAIADVPERHEALLAALGRGISPTAISKMLRNLGYACSKETVAAWHARNRTTTP